MTDRTTEMPAKYLTMRAAAEYASRPEERIRTLVRRHRAQRFTHAK